MLNHPNIKMFISVSANSSYTERDSNGIKSPRKHTHVSVCVHTNVSLRRSSLKHPAVSQLASPSLYSLFSSSFGLWAGVRNCS